MIYASPQSAAHPQTSEERRSFIWIKDPCAIFRNRNLCSVRGSRWVEPRTDRGTPGTIVIMQHLSPLARVKREDPSIRHMMAVC